MLYNVEILDELFCKKLPPFVFGDRYANAPQTAKVTVLNDNGSVKEIVEYGYKTPEEIQQAIDEHKDIDITWCYISDIDFSSQKLQSIRADYALFSKRISFRGASIDGSSYFRDTIFCNDAVFNYTKFNGDVDFSFASFNGYAVFWDTAFNGNTVFEHSTFYDETDFRDVTVTNAIRFSFAKFSSYTNLAFRKCNTLDLYCSKFEKPCTVSSNNGFTTVSFHNCQTIAPFSVPFDNNLKHAIMNCRKTRSDIDNKVFAQQFNFLKINYNRNGEYEYEDQAYTEYRRSLRKTKNCISRFLEWIFLDGISGYCTKPFRVFFAAIIAIIIFACLYNIPGTVEFTTDNYKGIWGAVYHSIISFFTIGFGESQPIGTVGLFLTWLEGFVSAFFLSLFTVSFVHKVLR